MLTIRFTDGAEWWVSGRTFDRLFQAGLDAGIIAPEQEAWWHSASANGGLSFALMKSSEAEALAKALCNTAEKELSKLRTVQDPMPEDRFYEDGLLKLLKA